MPHTLLLADDSVTIQRVIELTFADEDVRVVAVSDGDQAIARLDEQPPDIVLADVGMPGRNGYEVARYVKSQPRLAHIPVLLLTGAFEPIDQVKADHAGCDGVLAKPFEPQIVISRVKELLARARGESAPPAAAAPAARLPSVPRPPDTSAIARDVRSNAVETPNSLVDYFDELNAAFAALLAAEQNTSASSGAAAWPPPPPPAIADELVERVAKRVLEELSDRVVRETVADLVSTIAERLVRDEIERIKSAIK